jgi:hypothetical protein
MDDHHLRRQRGERDCRSQADRRGQGRRHRQCQYRRPGPGSGLLDEVTMSLVPVLMGEGIPYFANLACAPHRFDDPVIILGSRVTHLRYAHGGSETGPALPQREHR